MSTLVALVPVSIGALCSGAAVAAGSPVAADRIDVDFAVSPGAIRPLHGVNNGPLISELNIDLTVFHAEAGFPFTRLHDSHRPYPDVVDIHCIFPDFDADPDKPESYHFLTTDDYLLPIVANHSQIVYRLGESIEHSPRKLHVHPPPDFRKWANICVHIIRHYNEGWAGGFHHGIKYWEVWNEPSGADMWTGTTEQYFELYETAARAIKAHDPSLQVGGPAASGVGSTFASQFLTWCRDRQVPLDFFSWHRYAGDPAALVRDAKQARELLDAFGFTATESHLNEWHFFDLKWTDMAPKDPGLYAKTRENYAHLSGPAAAAFAAAALIHLQDAPVDVCNYYTADNSRWGMFDQYGAPGKVYYAFLAFNNLMQTPERVACGLDESSGAVAVLAGLAHDKGSAGLLVANTSREAGRRVVSFRNLPWSEGTSVEVIAVDEKNDFAKIADLQLDPNSPSVELEAPAASVRLLRLTARK